MSELQEFQSTKLKPLPVIVLADISGSMEPEAKISALNAAMREMLSTFADGDDLRAQIHTAVITFGGQARLHLPLQPASAVAWTDMTAGGGTPMGAAMTLAAEMIEDREQIPGHAYRPAIILVSDGLPTDSWLEGFDRLTKQGRAQKADRFAIAIGADADQEMLRRFVGNDQRGVFFASDARKIRDCFQRVTMTVVARSRQANVNQVVALDNPFALDDQGT